MCFYFSDIVLFYVIVLYHFNHWWFRFIKDIF